MKTAHLKAVSNACAEIPLQDASLDIWDKKYRLKTKEGVAVDQDIDGTGVYVFRWLRVVHRRRRRGAA